LRQQARLQAPEVLLLLLLPYSVSQLPVNANLGGRLDPALALLIGQPGPSYCLPKIQATSLLHCVLIGEPVLNTDAG
jgi:hypothetical protein